MGTLQPWRERWASRKKSCLPAANRKRFIAHHDFSPHQGFGVFFLHIKIFCFAHFFFFPPQGFSLHTRVFVFCPHGFPSAHQCCFAHQGFFAHEGFFFCPQSLFSPQGVFFFAHEGFGVFFLHTRVVFLIFLYTWGFFHLRGFFSNTLFFQPQGAFLDTRFCLVIFLPTRDFCTQGLFGFFLYTHLFCP